MSRKEWDEHMATLGLATKVVRGPLGNDSAEASLAHMRSGCTVCAARKRTHKANRQRRDRHGAMRGLGLVKTPYGWE